MLLLNTQAFLVHDNSALTSWSELHCRMSELRLFYQCSVHCSSPWSCACVAMHAELSTPVEVEIINCSKLPIL
jgi:hypothetical protein